MSAKSWLLMVTIGILLPSGAAFGQQGIRWQPTLDSAKRAAARDGRLVLAYFYADWCGACRIMQREVLEDPAVAEQLQADYVAVKINADHFPTTARQYGVRHQPTTVAILPTAKGEAVHAQRGRVDKAAFVEPLKRTAADIKRHMQQSYAARSALPAPAPHAPSRSPAVPSPALASRARPRPPAAPSPAEQGLTAAPRGTPAERSPARTRAAQSQRPVSCSLLLEFGPGQFCGT